MRPFVYERATNTGPGNRAASGTGQGQTDARVQFLAGGTSLIDLMKLDVLRPQRLVDLAPMQAAHNKIEAGPEGLKLGALAKMSEVERNAAVVSGYPVIAQSLQLAASAQLRNMATLGGNVLQKTRCPYYRDVSWEACNKRNPGSGCTAIHAPNRNLAVLGVDDSCIAQYPGDFAVALIALEASVDLQGPQGSRRMPFAELHASANGQPHIENTLREGEILTVFHIPAGPWNERSLFLKIRDRASYEFALSSAAVALDLDGDHVRQARIGLGGIAYRPWRSREAEEKLTGKPLTEQNAEAAARAALQSAKTHGGNAFKPELARRTLVRALLQAKNMNGMKG
jgi:xanthine dehydrogenase YagS FAD-binding subunit